MVSRTGAKTGERRATAKRLAARHPQGAHKFSASVDRHVAPAQWDAAVDDKLAQTYFQTRSTPPPATVPRRRSPLLVASVSLFTCVVGLWVVLGPAHQLFSRPAAPASVPGRVQPLSVAQDAGTTPPIPLPLPKLHGEEFLQFVTFPHGGLDVIRDRARDVWIVPGSAHGSPWRGGFLPALPIDGRAFLNVQLRSLGSAPMRVLLEFKHEASDLLRGVGGKTAVIVPDDGQWHVYSLSVPQRARQPMNYFAISDPTGPFELVSASVSDRALGVVLHSEPSASTE